MAFRIPSILAVLPDYPSLREAVAFQLNGLIVVFLALGSIWGLLELMGLFFRHRPATAVAAPSRAAPAPLSATPTGALTPEITAVIAAAVATVLPQPHRIHSIATGAPPPQWANEGRRDIFGSHRIR